jgi:hypothetical protein
MSVESARDFSSESDEESPEIGTEGLSAETLALLAGFNMTSHTFDDDDEEEITETSTNKDLGASDVCVAYTQKDVSMIAQTFTRLQEEREKSAALHAESLKNRVVHELEAPQDSSVDEMIRTLRDDGMLRVNSVLLPDTCDECLCEVNAMLKKAQDDGINMTAETGYGNVLARKDRWDMYLRNEGKTGGALSHIFGGDKQHSLNLLFEGLFGPPSVLLPVNFHELSALVSDKGAPTQPIHPDSKFTDVCPLYTVFIALQDVEASMGPTLFLPGTNTKSAHDRMTSTAHTKDEFLIGCQYRQGLLKKGDCVVMDSRSLHCGDANDRSRRVLLYFTLRNPLFSLKPEDFPPSGSLWENYSLQVSGIA